jgi:hypothetical protein
MFLATETSGAGGGGTSYGGAGGASGGGDMPDAPTGTTDDPLPASGVDIAPRPGIDLNLPADQTIVRIMDTPGGPLFPAATSPSGFTPIAGFQVGGWQLSIGTQTTDSYTNMPGTGPYTPYSGNLVGPYSGGPQEGVGSNQYTGTLPTEPYSNTVVASPASTGDQTGPTPVQRDTLDNEDAAIQQMVQRFQKYDQDLAASQAAQSQQAQIQTQPATPTNAPGTATSAGSAQPPPPASATTAGNSPADDSILPWGPAAAVGAASNLPNVPRATPPVSGQPANLGLESSGAWDRANPSQAAQAAIQDQIAAGFLDPSYGRPGANISSATASTEGSINRLIRGQTAEVSAYQARRAQGEIGILAPKGASVRGLDYATASRLPSGEYQINVADTASRYTTNPFKTSPGTAKPTWLGELANTFGPNGNFRLSDPAAEQGIRDAHAAGRISPVQIDTVDFSPQGQGRMTVNGVEVPIDSATTPTRGGGAGPGGGGTGNAAATGAALGGGIATLINAIQILWNPDAHPEAVRELVTTAFLGTASGATGATIESTFARSFASATGGAEASSIESAAGRSLGGAFAGGPAAAIFTLGQMALSDKEYTTVDYEAKGTRSFVSGTAGGLSGALAAGAVGAIGLSEVPLLGTAVGFVGGFLGYLAFDALFGDDVEDAVRGQPAQMGDFEVVQDPSGFLT